MLQIQNETSVENINIQNITPGGATITIAGTTLDPAPFVSLSVEQYRAGDLILGGALIVSLNGTVYTTSGFSDIATKLREKFSIIGQKGDCVDININCNGSILVNGFGNIRSVNIEEGPDPTWTQIAAYSIEIEMFINNNDLVVKPNTAASNYVSSNEILRDLSESITLNVDSDAFTTDNMPTGQKAGRAHAKYTFSISASGGAVGCKNQVSHKTGLEAAEEVIKRRISSIENGTISSGLTMPASLSSALSSYHSGPKYMHIRSIDADPIGGTMTVNGELILRPTGTTFPQAFIDLTVDSRTDATQVGRTVTISGNVEGLHSTSFSDLITNGDFHASNAHKIGNAESAYSGLQSSFQSLANAYLIGLISDTSDCTSGGLLDICSSYVAPTECNIRLVNRSVTRNLGQGTISFSEEYSTARNCSIPGAAKVDSEVTHTYPTDLFAEFTIPFRGEPLLQNLGTTSKETVSVNVNVTVENPGCDVRDLTGIIGCAQSEANALGVSEGAAGWYVTQNIVTKTNTGNLRVTKEWTKPYNC